MRRAPAGLAAGWLSRLLAVLLALGACGGGDGDAAPTTSLTEPAAARPAASAPAPSPTTSAAAMPTTTATTAPAPASATTGATIPATTGEAAGTAPTTPATTPAATVAPAAPDTTPPATEAPPSGPAATPLVIDGADGFRVQVQPIDSYLRGRMEPTSWRPGCPVGLDELRYLQIDHWDFAGTARTGELVVHRDAVDAIVAAFQSMWSARFPIHRMVLIDEYGGDDFTSIEADNTSAFNCRFVAGTTRWSNHATGRAIDVNPLENPYVSDGRTDHPASEPYLDRGNMATGVIVEGGPAVAAFDAVGWGWGGRWSGVADYQHFSASGS